MNAKVWKKIILLEYDLKAWGSSMDEKKAKEWWDNSMWGGRGRNSNKTFFQKANELPCWAVSAGLSEEAEDPPIGNIVKRVAAQLWLGLHEPWIPFQPSGECCSKGGPAAEEIESFALFQRAEQGWKLEKANFSLTWKIISLCPSLSNTEMHLWGPEFPIPERVPDESGYQPVKNIVKRNPEIRRQTSSNS